MRVFDEAPVALESLDDHLKALLRLKLREFVHLSPWFKGVPSIDSDYYDATAKRIPVSRHIEEEEDCPNKGHRRAHQRIRPVIRLK